MPEYLQHGSPTASELHGSSVIGRVSPLETAGDWRGRSAVARTEAVWFDQGVPRRRIRPATAVGVVLVVVGLAGGAVFQLQPWRSCPDDESPTACPMLPQDANAFLAFVLVLLVGIAVLSTATTLRRRAQSVS